MLGLSFFFLSFDLSSTFSEESDPVVEVAVAEDRRRSFPASPLADAQTRISSVGDGRSEVDIIRLARRRGAATNDVDGVLVDFGRAMAQVAADLKRHGLAVAVCILLLKVDALRVGAVRPCSSHLRSSTVVHASDDTRTPARTRRPRENILDTRGVISTG